MHPRRIMVRHVRDLIARPLTPHDYFRRPLIRRSRWLVQAWDYDHRAWQRFYLGSSLEYRAPGELRVALYEPGAKRPLRIVSRGYRETTHDRFRLARSLKRLQEMDLEDLRLGVIATDMRLIE